MINGQRISGLVLVADAVWGCYPFVQAIRAMLPVVDEMVVVYHKYGRNDGTFEALQTVGNGNNEKVRLIPSVFDIEKNGWAAYGIARTQGYQACRGDVVLMFDADGVLHENEEGLLSKEIGDFVREGNATGYWEKHRLYKPDLYYPQHKHSGIYSKAILGDRLDFMRADGKGAPNFDRLTPAEQVSKKFSVTLFGYEHVWDTEEVLRYKTNRYGRMIDILNGKPPLTPEQYFKNYMEELVAKLKAEGKPMPLHKHPLIMKPWIDGLNKTHFGYDLFGWWKGK